jgi:protein-L-isoaspartate(D-aspartate) O-methyltransferase
VNSTSEPTDATALRESLIHEVARRSGASPDVLEALRAVPRERFMPEASLSQAYVDAAHPIGQGQTISQPTVVAMMTEALDLSSDSRVLEIGTGCGYQTAVLARLARHVFSIERIAPLLESAQQRLDELGIGNVTLRVGDGYAGWAEYAPFDRILLTAAPPEVPPILLDQLVEGGRLVAPVGPRLFQELVRITKRGEAFDRENLGAVAFVPMVPGM